MAKRWASGNGAIESCARARMRSSVFIGVFAVFRGE
jgi:hypothetical protein